MSFFNKIGKTITDTSKDLAQKAKVMSEISSLNGQVQAEEEKIQSLFIKIGKQYYEANKMNADTEYGETLASITASFSKIDELTEAIQVIKGAAICSNCGAQIPEGAVFCPECGTKNEREEEIVVDAEGRVCPECGTEVAVDALFCGGCGKKLEASKGSAIGDAAKGDTVDGDAVDSDTVDGDTSDA
ncbi:zinc-ribbon domain-containing protein [Fusibacter paucivorans]|uniref:Zinc-ribbon domain-containing protein n=1 Tax=Fusibacter paucivorans TaxID=76009 RepID=A0ABS5PTS0_9FIRM|nr:zinc ribbon domain-containing protein [Fusibacter paucivorans]MBS7528312.1 zinc-ribbon domain-containing protein [Fusibacter paucivorans]